MSRFSEALTMAKNEITEWADVSHHVQMPKGKGHPKIIMEYAGKQRFIVFALSCSDQRAIWRMRAQIRNELKTLGASRSS